MRMPEKCRNNNSDNPLTSRRSDGGKKKLKKCVAEQMISFEVKKFRQGFVFGFGLSLSGCFV